jgi:DNA repair exonuclease SbcCD ATPase subunit
MVELKSLRLSNFFSVEEAEIPLNLPGVSLIVGPNGAGKTSLFFEGPFYALFGQSFEYGQNPGNEVMNERSTGGMLVRLEFTVNGVDYTVVRSRGRRDVKDGVQLLQGERSLTQGTITATQTAINRLVGCTAKSFSSSVMFPVSVTRFVEQTDSARKALLDDMLELSELSEAHERTKKCVQQAQEALQKTKEGVSSAEARLSSVRRSHASLEAEEAAFQTRLFHWDETQANLEHQIALHQTQLDALRTRLTEAAAEVQQQIAQEPEISAKETNDAVSKATGEVMAISGAMAQAKSRVSKLRSTDQVTCRQCGQNLPDAEHRAMELGKAEETLSRLEALLKRANVAEAEAIKQQSAINKQITESRQRSMLALAGVADLETQVATKTGQVNSLIAKRADRPTSPYEKMLEDSRTIMESAMVALTEKEEAVKVAVQDLQDEEALKNLFGPRGARTLVLEHVIPWLNYHAAQYAEKAGGGIQVAFRIRDAGESSEGTLQVEVRNPNGSNKCRGSSTGEKRKINFLCMLALLELASIRGGKGFGATFFDETCENLDEAGIAGVCEILREMKTRKQSVFVISHAATASLSTVADRIITVSPGGAYSLSETT